MTAHHARRISATGKPPGRLDALNTRELYLDTSNPYGIAELERIELPSLPDRWVAWPQRKRAEPGDGLHFYCDDYRFEGVWTNPDRYDWAGKTIIAPDYSVYTDYPRALAVWQTYRARWTARALAERGATVIPSVVWGAAEHDDVTFAGLPVHSTVAISCYGASRFPDAFERGYNEMIERLEPVQVIVIGGKMPDYILGARYYAVAHIERVRNGR